MLTPQKFVENLKIQTSDASVRGIIDLLEKPSGRKPDERDVDLSRWYHSLSLNDQRLLKLAFSRVADLAVFEVLCVIDGVAVIENDQGDGAFKLWYEKGGNRQLLNDKGSTFLHDLLGH